MNRRGFLQGLVASVAGGTALVKLATPAEASALVVNQSALIGQPELMFPECGVGTSDGLVYIQNPRTGAFEPIGYITCLNVRREIHEIKSWDGHVELVPGLRRASLDFAGSTK